MNSLTISVVVSSLLHRRSSTIDPSPTASSAAVSFLAITVTAMLVLIRVLLLLLLCQQGGPLPVHFQKLVRLFPLQRDAVHDRIEGLTVTALHAQKVPRPGFLGPLTIVARNGHDPRQFGRHGLHGNRPGHGVPGRHHALAGFGRLFADRAAAVVGGELAEAVPVNGVAAGHFVGGAAAGKEVFLADGAVAAVFAGFAVVGLIETAVDAHAALVAVLKVGLSADATKAAVGAVIGTLLVGHPQVANVAVVCPELDRAGDAVICFAGLACEALAANDFTHSESVYSVVILFRYGGGGL